MTIVFRNAGVIDPMSITTFGASSKQDKSAIGFFGTGLKYAIAILLRHGCEIVITTGHQRLEFSTRKTRIRNDDFDVVLMNGEPMGFTTEVGKTWELSSAYRELYCNCADEKGQTYEIEDGAPIVYHVTDTYVEVTGAKFDEVWQRRDEIILPSKALHVSEGMEIHPGRSDFVYYRGVRVAKLESPTLFTYNILGHVDLTEDRTLKYPWEAPRYIRKGLIGCNVRHILDTVLRAPEGSYEHAMGFEGSEPSQEFIERVTHYRNTNTLTLSKSAIKLVLLYTLGEAVERRPMVLTTIDQRRLEKAIQFCKTIGFPVDEFNITVLDFLGEGVLGQVFDGRILLAHRVFLMGTKMLAGTLIEEFLHLKHGVYDETRPMQNLLIDHICQLGEMVTGDTL